MPQADLKYSADLEIDVKGLLAAVERVILSHDQGAGACKGRAFAARASHHAHLLLEVSVLRKPHRDDAFMQALLADLVACVDGALPSGTERAVSLSFASPFYVTGQS